MIMRSASATCTLLAVWNSKIYTHGFAVALPILTSSLETPYWGFAGGARPTARISKEGVAFFEFDDVGGMRIAGFEPKAGP